MCWPCCRCPLISNAAASTAPRQSSRLSGAAYSAAKYGLRGLHDALSAEYRGTGVRLSLVSPGPTDTDMWDPVDPDRRDDLPDRAQMLKADDVAEAITWVVTRPDHLHVDWLRFGPV